MTGLPKGFYVGEVYCLWRGMPGEETVMLLPGAPTIAGGAKGASMLDSADGATLTLRAGWSVDPDALPAISAEIARHSAVAGEVDPQEADFTSARASLEFIGTNGETYTVGPNESSGLSGCTVVFSVTLTATEKQRALAAISGSPGFVKLIYEAELELREECVARLQGDLASDLAALSPAPTKPEKPETSGGIFGWGKKKPPPPPPPAPPTRQACADRIETGIAEGRLTLTLRATPNASTALQDKLAASVKELATGILFDAARAGAGMTALPVNFRKSDTELHRYQIRRSADLGPDLAAIGAERLVHKAPVPIASPLR